jgi:hypothetical protein
VCCLATLGSNKTLVTEECKCFHNNNSGGWGGLDGACAEMEV